MLDEAAAVAYFYETLRKVDDFTADDDGTFEASYRAFIDGLTTQFEDAMNDDFHVVRGMKLFMGLQNA